MDTRVSVAMAVYNGERFLRESIESVLGQTYANFEFIIVDDGSTDSSAEIIKSYRDERIVSLSNQRNVGLTRSLNRCLEIARGEYIARLDADDVCLPRRLERQVSYLDGHNEVGLVGTWFERINVDGESLGVRRLPTRSAVLRWGLLFGTPMAHPSMMFRRRLVEELGGYDEDLRYAQDHELWVRYAFESAPANIPEPLIRLRRHSGSVSASHNQEQWRVCDVVTQKAAERLLGRTIPLERIANLLSATERLPRQSLGDLDGMVPLLQEVYAGFCDYWRPSATDRLRLRFDVARKLVKLAGHMGRSNRPTATDALRRAVLTDPRIVATRPFWMNLGGFS